MPKRGGALTPMEVAFIGASREGHEPIAAAALAGYQHPVQLADQLMARPLVGPAARAAVADFVKYEAPKSVLGLAKIAWDPRTPAGSSVRAHIALIELSGIGADDKDSTDPAEMTLDELRRATEKTRLRASLLEHALADAASPVIEGDSKPGSVLD